MLEEFYINQTSPSLIVVVGKRLSGTTTLVRDILRNWSNGTVLNSIEDVNNAYGRDNRHVVQHLDANDIESIKSHQSQTGFSEPYYIAIDNMYDGISRQDLVNLVEEHKKYNITLVITMQEDSFLSVIGSKVDYTFTPNGNYEYLVKDRNGDMYRYKAK